MVQAKRPIHRGVTISALEEFQRTRKPIKLVGCIVHIHQIRPSDPGCYFVQVSGEHSASVYWIDVTTCDYERSRERAVKLQNHRTKQVKRSQWV